MTTTEVPLGIEDGKPSSRVLRPPGGGSSFSLGGADPAPPPQKPRQSASDASPATVTPSPQTKSTPTPDNTQAEGKPQSWKPVENSHSRIFGDSGPAAESPARGRDLSKGGGNPITGQQNTTPEQSSTKVRQPPGGFSHGIF